MRNFRIVRQRDQADCGVACLASIIEFYGGVYVFENLRRLSGTDAKGTTLLGIYEAANQIGFDAEGYEVNNIEDLVNLVKPAILHVILENGLHHFIVLYSLEKGNCIVGDPSKGVKALSRDDLIKIWQTKTVLELKPNSKFIKGSDKLYKRRWIYELLVPDSRIIFSTIALSIVLSLLGFSIAIFTQKLIDDIVPSGNNLLLFIGLVGLFFLLITRSLLGYSKNQFLNNHGKTFNNRIIKSFFSNVFKLPQSFFDSRKTGDLVARLNDSRRIQSMVKTLVGSSIIDLFITIVSVIITFYYSSFIGVIMIFFTLLYFLGARLLMKNISTLQVDVMQAYASTESHFVNFIQGISVIRSFSRVDFFENSIVRIYEFFELKIYKLNQYSFRFAFFSEFIGALFFIAILSSGSYLLINSDISVGELFAILSIAGLLLPSITRLVMFLIQVEEARIAFDRMFEFTQIESNSISLKTTISSDERIVIDKLTAHKISFKYPGQLRLIEDVSFEISKGEVIGILGKSGEGKSTILSLLQGIYSPTDGGIFINDIPSSEFDLTQIRRSIGFVPQDIKIFNGTILYNITLSDKVEDHLKAIEIMNTTGLNVFFERVKNGYYTEIGEDGIKLSGGEKQCLGIARALYIQPSVLLLDEPTSSIDTEAEHFILKSLSQMRSNVAIIIVTHRIRPIYNADRIYILKNGIIHKRGTPKELIMSDNFFRTLYHNDTRSFI